MKRLCIVFLFLLLIFLVVRPRRTNIQQAPVINSDGSITIGRSCTVKAPEGFALLTENNILAADGLYYVSWASGESSSFVSSDEETVELYPIQLHMLVNECSSAKTASENSSQWLKAAKDKYTITDESVISVQDIAFTVISCSFDSADSLLERGVSAFASSNDSAFCIEITCLPGVETDLSGVMQTFLDQCTIIA